jgi:hypothetical protein
LTHTNARTFLALSLIALLSVPLGSCGMFKKKPVPTPQRSAPTVVRDIPSPLRGTIGAEARVIGNSSTLVSGIGFVVGLDGTGGLPIPEQYAAHLEREMGLNGISVANDDPNSPLRGMSPRALLNDPNTAAVIVQAAVPPGAKSGESFDVYVRAINATSLEGGKLWTTRLRVGPPSTYADPQARVIAEAKGPLFLNPFAEPGNEYDAVSRNVGRILDGGYVTETSEMQIIMDNPSHQRARQIVRAINTMFPSSPSERYETARGVDETLVLVQVPQRYADRREEFVQLITHLTIDQSYPEIYAQRYATALENQPYLAGDMSWCLQALGKRALPAIRDLYSYPEAAPRLAALRAGAGLEDPKCVEPLSKIALEGPANLQTDAISLLSRIQDSMVPDRVLRELLESDQLAIRIEAYEGLMNRAINARKRRIASSLGTSNRAAITNGVIDRQLDVLARVQVSNDPVRGVTRTLVGGKFFLDIVPFGDPLIYISQQREPRIVLFGADQVAQTPLLATAWSDRLMLAADEEDAPIRVYYRDDKARRTFTHGDVPKTLPGLVQFLATEPTPGSRTRGLGLSYSQVVGALYEIYGELGMGMAFATEEDQLLASLLRTAQPDDIELRPETSGGETTLAPIDDPTQPVVENRSGLEPRRTLLVPVNPPAPEPGSEQSPAPARSEQPAPSTNEPAMRAE